MAISKIALGMNARNFLYIRRYNPSSAKKIADNKLIAKKIFEKNNISSTKLFHAFDTRQSILDYDWELPKDGFAIKPARGYGGEGVLIFDTWNKKKGRTTTGEIYTVNQLESHIFDIFEGAYSLQYLPDIAFIEERIRPDKFNNRLSKGILDIRVIVFKMVPLMAMMRIPTPESMNKANLHLGAIAAGIDMATGITTNAISHDKPIIYLPDGITKTVGIKIPNWDSILNLAVRTQKICKLGYMGVDIVIDKNKGPMVLEVNARPGLSIQIANRASLRTRLEMVENLNVASVERGIELGKSLFAEDSDKLPKLSKTLQVVEPINLINKNKSKSVQAKIDTGAFRTSLDEALVSELGLEYLPKKIFISSASGQQNRPAVRINFELAGRKISTIATVARRSHLQYPVIVGRRDMKGFLVNPTRKRDFDDYSDEYEGEDIVLPT